MSTWVASAIVAAYASWALELTVLHVPSVASSRRIWSSPVELTRGYSPSFQQIFGLPKALKLLLFGAPLVVIYAVYTYPLLVLSLGTDPFGDYLFAPDAATEVAGVMLLLAGRAVALASAWTIRRQNAQTGDSFHLHVAGPFRWSRNPGLVGMYVFAGGLWVLTPSAAMLLGIAVYVVYMHFKVRMEEDFLVSKFGRTYADYRRRTSRYLP